ncbi:MAG: electron transfer flavoprotein subunit alpha [Spirochaetia bacterium]|jgi:electron transfer flavoprotein alpha subunit
MNGKSIYVYGNLCNQCGACIQACPSDAIALAEEAVRIDEEKCTLCALCVKACEQHALRIERGRAVARQGVHRDVWVFAEHRGGLHLPCLQVVSKAGELARSLGERLVVAVVGVPPFDREALAASLRGLGVHEVRLLGCRQLGEYFPEDVAEVLRGDIEECHPRIVLLLGSLFGRSMAPRLAAKLQTGLTADCSELSIDENGNLVQVRPTYGGRILASILCQTSSPQMASVRQNVFEVRRDANDGAPPVISEKTVAIDSIERLKRVLRTEPLSKCGTPIEEADVIVCGGLGLGSADGFALLQSLADKIGGVVAGTRETVDRGWIPFSQQIGQTGKTVRPRLYIGAGVSGAIHHMMGMKHARNIVAINTDPRAPIFKIATICMVGDLYEVLPSLILRL